MIKCVLIIHQASLNKGNHDRDAFGDLILISTDFFDFISPFSS